MKYKAKVQDKELKIQGIRDFLERFDNKNLILDVTTERFQRTNVQNNALHLLFTQTGLELNECGMEANKFIRFDIPWDNRGYMVKEQLWKPLQEIIVGHTKTRNLKRDQLDKIYVPFMNTIAERTQGEVNLPFPSEQALIDQI